MIRRIAMLCHRLESSNLDSRSEALTERHVVVVHQYALPRSQGGGTRHIELFTALRHWRTSFLAGDRNYQTGERFAADDPRFVLLRVPGHEGNGGRRMWGWAVFAAKASARLIFMPRVDVVYASTPQLLVPAVAVVVARLRRIPLVLEIRDLWPETLVAAGSVQRHSLVHRALLVLEKFVVRAAAHIVIVTPGWVKHLERLGVPASRVTSVPNGAEPSREDLASKREYYREKFGLGGFTAVYAGAHGPANGLHQVLALAATVPDIRIIFVGGGSEKSSLHADARRRGLSNVSFFDSMPKDELFHLLAAADVGIHSISPLSVLQAGMSPNKLFDYLAAGLPVVSNAGSALHSVITDDQVGALVGPDQLAAGIARVRAANASTRERWRQNGRELLANKYSRSAASQRLELVLDDVSRSSLGVSGGT